MNVKSILELIALLDLRKRHLQYDEKVMQCDERTIARLSHRVHDLESAIKFEIGYYEQWVKQDPDCDAARTVLDRLKTIVSS